LNEHQVIFLVCFVCAREALKIQNLSKDLVLLGRRARLLGLLRQQNGVDVRQNTTRRDRDGAEELGELFVVADRELDVARHDARLLVVARGVTREFEHFGAQVFLRARKTQRFNASVFVHRPDATLARPERSISNFKFQKTTHHDSRQVHRRAGADARRVLASLQVARDPADRELQARLGGSARRLLRGFSFTSSRHRSRRVVSRAVARARIASRARARALEIARSDWLARRARRVGLVATLARTRNSDAFV